VEIAYSSFVDRLNDSAARFFAAVLNDCMRSPVSGMTLELQERYARFATVFIQDSTIIRLSKKLADRFPAVRSKTTAGVKVACLLNVLASGPRTVSIVPERRAEIKTLRIGRWVAGSLLLVDLGFYAYHLFARIHENRGFFVSRVKKASNLRIEAVHSPMDANLCTSLIGQNLLSAIPGLGIQSFDATVSVQLKRRVYRGKRRRERYTFRCVGRVHPDTGEWRWYLTNLSPKEFTVDEIAKLYRFRWEIETLFDEAKNECNLGDIAVKREGASMALLYAMLIRQVILKRVYLVLRTLLDEKTRQKLSPDLFGRGFIEQMDLLLETLVDEGKEPEEQIRGREGWNLWFARLCRHGLQYHPKKLARDAILKR
ncbi:IS4 family transposase, partial [Tepidanaerobacter sp. EBM-38]|uniref:IS4 family transposase n=1 Tax=Tepidanaerobacter sp. EBM-38 TaxID=1918496 RepID=UPI0025EBA86B